MPRHQAVTDKSVEIALEWRVFAAAHVRCDFIPRPRRTRRGSRRESLVIHCPLLILHARMLGGLYRELSWQTKISLFLYNTCGVFRLQSWAKGIYMQHGLLHENKSYHGEQEKKEDKCKGCLYKKPCKSLFSDFALQLLLEVITF